MSKHRGLVCVFARGKMLFIAALLLFAGPASAEDKEPFAVVPLGERQSVACLTGGSSFGPTAAIEFTPIKDWLEIETGVTPLFSRGLTE
jgi:hypothetical protein